ncbi:MAG TPA: hypothetical protein VJ724_03625 [Tahibacter sp.]|nr:hypothetical protein [Tahibacter sp.]
MTTQHYIDRDGSKAQLVVLTDEAIYAETFSAADGQRHVRELAAGKAPGAIFGKDASAIFLRTIRRVQIDDNDSDVDVTHADGDKETRTSLRFAENDVRDAVYAALRERLAAKLREHVDEVSRPRAAVGSLTALTVFGIGTVVLAQAAAAIQAAGEVEITGRRAGLKKLVTGVLDTLGPTGVSIIGGILCLLALLVFVQRMREPPRLRFLQAAPWNGPSNVATVFKYALLVAVWGFVAKAALV